MTRPRSHRPRGVRVHGEVEAESGPIRERVLEIVRAIPPGRIMTYGQIASLLGCRLSPLAVGWMLHRCPDDVPWHRVVNAAGRCSTERLPDIPRGLQRALLEAEGVEFHAHDCLDVESRRWWPGDEGGD